MYHLLLLTTLFRAIYAKSDCSVLPVVIWHGLGDSYDNPALQDLADTVAKHKNAFVHLVRLGENAGADKKGTFFGDSTANIEYVAEQLSNIPEIADCGSFDGIGLSQGGLFLRGYSEFYNLHPSYPHIRNLITLGSPHYGISELPACSPGDWLCKTLEWALKGGVWSTWAQKNVVPAQYWRNEEELDKYYEMSGFLRDLNNERLGDPEVPDEERNQTLKKAFMTLENFVMFSFSRDITIVPPTSANFTLLDHADPAMPLPWEELPLYQKDYIGLRTLNEAGKVHKLVCDGFHMEINKDCWSQVMEWIGSKPEQKSPRIIVQL